MKLHKKPLMMSLLCLLTILVFVMDSYSHDHGCVTSQQLHQDGHADTDSTLTDDFDCCQEVHDGCNHAETCAQCINSLFGCTAGVDSGKLLGLHRLKQIAAATAFCPGKSNNCCGLPTANLPVKTMPLSDLTHLQTVQLLL